MGQDLVLPGHAVRVERLDREGDPAVQVRPPLGRQRLVRDVLRHRVGEGIRELGERALLLDELGGLQLAQRLVASPGRLADTLEEPPAELAADHRRDLEDLSRRVTHLLDAGQDHVLDGGRHDERVEIARHDQPVPLPAKHLRLLERAEHLLHEEGVPLRPADEQALQGLRKVLGRQQPARHRQAVRRRQGRQGEPRVEQAVADERGMARPVRQDHEAPVGRETVRQRRDELLRRPVDPVQVLPHDDDRPALGGEDELPPHRLEDLRPPELRVQLEDPRVAGIDRQEMAHERERRPEVLAQLVGRPLDLLDDDRLGITLVDPERAPEEIDEGMERNRAREGQSLPLEPRRSLADLTPELPEEAGLADPGLPHDGHDLPAPRLRLVEALAQEPELGLTADEAGEPLLDVPSGHEPVRAGGRSGHGAGRGQLEAPSQEGRRLSAHHHGARRGRVSQGFQDGPGGTLRVPIDRHSLAVSTDLHQLGVKGHGDRRAGGVLLLCPGRHCLDRDRRKGRVMQGILQRLEAEGGDQPRGTQLVHDAPEAPDLVDDRLHGPAELGGHRLAFRGQEPSPQEGHAPRLPADARQHRALRGGRRRRGGPFRSSGRRDRHALLRAVRGRAAGAQPVLFHAVAEGVPGNAQLRRRLREVPLDRAERGEQAISLGLRVRRPGRAPLLGGAGPQRAATAGRLQPETRRGHGGALPEQRHPFHDVAELSHVPGPRVAEEGRARLSRQGLERHPVLLAGAPQKVLGEAKDVLAPLPERRQPQRDDGQPVVEILPEPASPDSRLQVLAGGGHEPDVDRLAPRAPEPPHGLLLEDLEELRLQALRQEPDLVEEQRPPVGRLEEPRLGLPGVRERAPLESEQLRLEQRLRDGGAVDVDERARGPRAGPVNRPRQQALPGPGLPEDQDRRQAPRAPGLSLEQAAHLRPDRRHAGTLTEQVADGWHDPNPIATPRCRILPENAADSREVSRIGPTIHARRRGPMGWVSTERRTSGRP